MNNYDELYEEKLNLLMELNKTDKITWSGKFRPDLNNMKIFPRPIDDTLPIWRAVGGPPASAIKAGRQGIPMMITTLGGPAMTFQDSIEQYRLAAKKMVMIIHLNLYQYQQQVYFILLTLLKML